MQSTLIVTEQPLDSGNGYQLVKFSGAFDKEGYNRINGVFDEILNRFSQLDNFTAKFLVFDFTDLEYINSQGIGTLMEIHNKLSSLGKSLVVIGLKQNVQDVFQAIGMNELVPVYTDLKAFKENK